MYKICLHIVFCFFVVVFFNFKCVLYCLCVHVFEILRYTMCEYYISYKFKLSIAMQEFLRYHKCTCNYKSIQSACYPGYITHTCIYSICLRLSSQVILQIFTSKRLSKENNGKRHRIQTNYICI